MEEKKFIVSSNSKTIDGSVENIVSTNQYNETISDIETYNITCVDRGIRAIVNETTFKAKVQNVEGFYQFFYIGENTWLLNGDEVALLEYGITFNDAPAPKINESVMINYFDNTIKISYDQNFQIFVNKEVNFLDVVSERTIWLMADNNDTNYSFHFMTKKFQIDTINTTFNQLSVNSTFEGFEKFNVQIIIAKREQ